MFFPKLRNADARPVLIALCLGLLFVSLSAAGRGQAPAPAFKSPGVVVSIEPNGFTMRTDAGATIVVHLPEHAKLLRVAPNEKTLKNATPITAADIGVGDRILVVGRMADDQKNLTASAAVVMSKADIAQKHEAESLAWQRGVGGLVSAVDAAASTITLSLSAAPGATKKILIHVSKETDVRRYAPDSVKFDDAKPATLDQIKPGDQLRARGTRSEDGSEFAAQGVVAGSFQNIAGTISSIDASQNTATVTDLKTKKPVLIRFTADTQLRKLPPEMAQRLAMRLKGGQAGGAPGGAGMGGGAGAGGGAGQGGGGGYGGARAGAPAAGGAPPAGGTPGLGGPGSQRPGGGAPDLQQILSRMPPAKLTDLQKGDAVMIVATQGTASGGVTAITALGGVEPILTASPSASQAMFMAGWNLSGAPSGGQDAAQ
jgi:hypothetical protein